LKIILITQNEPFYLAENISYLLKIIPKHSEVVAAVVAKPSPFGKKENFLNKAIRTYKIFGMKFFFYYSIKFILNTFKTSKSLDFVLRKNSIKKIQLNKSINHKESIELINSHKPDLLISILGNEIFKKPIINLAKQGCLNLHTALLPKYRGLMPSFWVLKNDEKFTGVSVFFVDEGIDSGPIIVQKKIEIKNYSQQQLIYKTKKIGMEAIAEAIDLIKNNSYELIQNDNNEKTYYSFPERKDVKEFIASGKRFF
tara:strand:+ start:5815 stop:6579 length:765 start_codon:yes stop_codon:yes gene_type:complete